MTRVNFVEAQSPSRADNSQTTSPLKPSTPTQGMSSRKPTPFPGCTPTKPSPLRDSATSKRQVSMASPPRPRLATRPTEVVADGGRFPAGTTSSTETLPFPVLPMPVDDGRQSPLSELRERILSDDREFGPGQCKTRLIHPVGSEKHQTRVRQLSGDLIASRMPNSASEDATPPQSTVAVPASNGTDASALGGRLDQLALWVKDVESELSRSHEKEETANSALQKWSKTPAKPWQKDANRPSPCRSLTCRSLLRHSPPPCPLRRHPRQARRTRGLNTGSASLPTSLMRSLLIFGRALPKSNLLRRQNGCRMKRPRKG